MFDLADTKWLKNKDKGKGFELEIAQSAVTQ